MTWFFCPKMAIWKILGGGGGCTSSPWTVRLCSYAYGCTCFSSCQKESPFVFGCSLSWKICRLQSVWHRRCINCQLLQAPPLNFIDYISTNHIAIASRALKWALHGPRPYFFIRDFGLHARVMCVRPHNLLRPPPPTRLKWKSCHNPPLKNFSMKR